MSIVGQMRGLADHRVYRCQCPLTFSLRTLLTVPGSMCVELGGEVGDKGDGCLCAESSGEAGDKGDGRGGGDRASEESKRRRR
jgi:hypothetical protein